MRSLFTRAALLLLMAMACAGRLAAQTPGFQVLHSFSGPANGFQPAASLTLGSDGNFYGTTQDGGIGNDGTVFKITPAGVLTTLYSFTGGANGSAPAARLIQGSDGNFYGTTAGDDGATGYGTVFQITPAGVLTTLYAFTGGADGSTPGAGVIQGSDGNFYGATERGSAGYGTVFQLTPAGVLITLHSFTSDADGADPICDLVQASDGSFYGTTYFGGGNGYGTVFNITSTGSFNTVYTFIGGAGGAYPQAGLILGSDGNFYGTTSAGGDTDGDGTVFQITPAGVLTTLCALTGGAGGSNPTAELTQGSDGNFYGTAINGGDSNGDGVVFKVTLTAASGSPNLRASGAGAKNADSAGPSGALSVIYTFTGGGDGANPAGALAFGSNGNLYGATSAGGSSTSDGTVFQITTAGALTTLYSFDSVGDGASPVTGLTQGSDGNLYGTTSTGVSGGAGTIFRITPAGALTKLYAFAPFSNLKESINADGAAPNALVLAGDGDFYGTTATGGADGDGVAFQLTPDGAYTSVHVFGSAAQDGEDPSSALIIDQSGNFYGTTSLGGANGDGAIFTISPAGVLSTLYSFSGGANGDAPEGGLTLGGDGNLYGTTSAGGDSNGDGTVYQITPAGVLTTLCAFTGGAGGSYPEGALTLGSDGSFYGTTLYGGDSNGDGTVFKVTVSEITPILRTGGQTGNALELRGVLTTLYTFTGGADGANPAAGLTLGSDGNFYGATSAGGGSAGAGTVFKITPAGVLTTLHVFSGADGKSQKSGLTLASDGNLYGTAASGGQNGLGVVYRLILAAPVVTGGTATAPLDSAFSFQIAATSDPTSYGASNLPPGLTVDATTGIISGTPTQTGTFAVGLTATNSIGTGSGTLSLTVSAGAPVVTSGTANAQEGAAFSFQIVASNSPTGFGASGLPAGLSVDASTGLISGTPTQSGAFTVGLSATNSAGTGSGTLSLTVNPPAPAITSALTASGQAGAAFTYQIAASNTPTSFGASGLPAGLSVDASTGLISGTPTVSGTFSVNLSATNAGGTGTGVLAITLAPALPAVTLAPTVPEVVLGSGDAGKFTLSIPAPLSADLLIKYSIKGTAINGVDYNLIKAHKKIKAGKTSKIINIIPQGDLGGASKKVVVLELKPEAGYIIGTTGKVKVKILAAP